MPRPKHPNMIVSTVSTTAIKSENDTSIFGGFWETEGPATLPPFVKNNVTITVRIDVAKTMPKVFIVPLTFQIVVALTKKTCKRSIRPIHLPPERLHLPARFLPRKPALHRSIGRLRRQPPFGPLAGFADQLRQPLPRDLAVARLAPRFLHENHNRPVHSPASPCQPPQPVLHRVGQVGRPRGLKPQFDRRGHFVHVLPAGAGRPGKALRQLPIGDLDLIVNSHKMHRALGSDVLPTLIRRNADRQNT